MQTYLLKADADLFERIDAVAGKRSRAEFIREACEMRLAGDAPTKKSDSVAKSVVVDPRRAGVVTQPPRKRDWSAEFPAVLAILPEHSYSVPALAKRLGWTDLKADRVLRDMEHRGLVRFDRGMVTGLATV